MIKNRLARPLGPLGVLLCCVVVAACGGSSKSTTSPAAAPSASTDKVTIQGFAFRPQADTVKKGTTVTWTNADTVPHTVQFTNNAFPTSSLLRANGPSYSATFNTAGTYNYICSIHTYMTGKIVVTP